MNCFYPRLLWHNKNENLAAIGWYYSAIFRPRHSTTVIAGRNRYAYFFCFIVCFGCMNTHICWCDGHVSTEKYRAYKRRTHKKRPSYGQSYCLPSTNPPATAFKAEREVLFIIWTFWRALICALSFFGRCHHYLFPAYIISIWQRRSSKEHSFACMCLCNALTAISRDCELVTNASFHGLFRVLLPSTHTHTKHITAHTNILFNFLWIKMDILLMS